LQRLALIVLTILFLACGSKAVKDAQTFLDVKEYGRAKELLELELKANPKHEEAYLLLGRTNLLLEDEDAAGKAFDTALLLDKTNKKRIGAAYAAAGQALYEGIPAGEEVQTERITKALAYLSRALTYDPDANTSIKEWALLIAKEQARTARTTHPLLLLGGIVTLDPSVRTDAARLAMTTATAYGERTFTEEAAIYARSAASWDPAHLKPAAKLLHAAGIASQDAGYLRLAIKWDPTLDDEPAAWALTQAGALPHAEYLRRYPKGAHAAAARPPADHTAEVAQTDTTATQVMVTTTSGVFSDGSRTPEEVVSVQASSPNALDRLITAAGTRALRAEELYVLNRMELSVLRNSIYARHGRRFKSAMLQGYFSSEPWYRENPNYHDGLLTTADRQNLATIGAAERAAR